MPAWHDNHVAVIVASDIRGATMLQGNCLQMIQKKQWSPNCQIWTHCRYHIWRGAMNKAFLKASEPKYNFWIKSRTAWRKRRKIFRRIKQSRVLERGWETTWRMVEDMLSICYKSKNVHAYGVCACLERETIMTIMTVRQLWDNFR